MSSHHFEQKFGKSIKRKLSPIRRTTIVGILDKAENIKVANSYVNQNSEGENNINPLIKKDELKNDERFIFKSVHKDKDFGLLINFQFLLNYFRTLSIVSRKLGDKKTKPNIVRVPFRLLPYACTLTTEEIIKSVQEKTSIFDDEIETSFLSFLGSMAYREINPLFKEPYPESVYIENKEEGLSLDIKFPVIELYINEVTYKKYIPLSGEIIIELLDTQFANLPKFVKTQFI